MARIARRPNELLRAGTSSLTAVARNVVSTAGTDGRTGRIASGAGAGFGMVPRGGAQQVGDLCV